MRKTAKGAVTLLICYFLLLSILALSLGLYSGVYQHFKRTLHDIESRKSFWLAEGGLQCALSQLNHERLEEATHKPVALGECHTEQIEKVAVTPLDPHHYRLSAVSGYYTVSGVVVMSNNPEYRLQWLQGSWSDYDQ